MKESLKDLYGGQIEAALSRETVDVERLRDLLAVILSEGLPVTDVKAMFEDALEYRPKRLGAAPTWDEVTPKT